MPTDVIMPKVDMVMDAGTIVHWYKAEGDPVSAGEALFDIETDKATMTIEAPGTGVLGPIGAPVAATVPVATVIAQILAPGETAPPAAPAEPQRPSTTPAPPAATAPAAQPHRDEPRPRATPLARKLAREHGLDLGLVAGSGAHGRIGKADILLQLSQTATPAVVPPPAESAREQRQITPGNGAAAPTAPAPTPDAPAMAPQPGEGQLVPLAGVRRIIAERLTLSAAIPQFTLTVDVDMTAARGLRERLQFRPSFTAIVARVVAGLLPRHPTLNAAFRPDGIWLHTPVHLGIALDSGGDLLVPVLRNAERASLRGIDDALRDMRERAGARQLKPAELQGSTFSISNLGMFGVDHFTALLNPPEAAILAVGRIVDRAVGVDGALALRPMLTLTLTVDHRVSDGAAGARFLQDVRAALEEPYLLL